LRDAQVHCATAEPWSHTPAPRFRAVGSVELGLDRGKYECVRHWAGARPTAGRILQRGSAVLPLVRAALLECDVRATRTANSTSVGPATMATCRFP